MRIGLPKGLLFYYYYPLWKPLFEELGAEVVVSRSTTAELMDKGVKRSVAEICVPIKSFTGHVIELLNMDVDYIFIPRLVSIHRRETFCPKFLGLPEMVCYTVPEAEGKLLTADIRTKNDSLTSLKDYRPVWEKLSVSRDQFKRALSKANRCWLKFRKYCLKGYTIDQATDLAFGLMDESSVPGMDNFDIQIGVIGYVYNIYDQFVSMDILKKLRSMGVGVKTFEMVDESYIFEKMGSLSKSLFWTFTNKLWGAADYFYKDNHIDGLIHVTAFGCGPDSMLGSVLELDSNKYGKPFMTVRVDEHTGENHLNTRVEAFIDMIRRKKYRLGEVQGL